MNRLTNTEQGQLHRIPDDPFTAALGESRQVPINTSVIAYDNAHCLVPGSLMGERIWVRTVGAGTRATVVIVHQSADGPAQVASHLKVVSGATSWLAEAASVGTDWIKVKMAEAVSLAKLHGNAAVDHALGLAATHHRFGYEELRSILAAGQPLAGPAEQANEKNSLAQGTRTWAHFGTRAGSEDA